MKKLVILFVAILSVGFASCSKDDDSGNSLSGKWEYVKNGSTINGTEILQNYTHATGCEKDYIMISASTFVDHKFQNQECIETTTPFTYTRNGNLLTVTYAQGTTGTLEIAQLDNTTLKVKTTIPGESAQNFVSIFVRR